MIIIMHMCLRTDESGKPQSTKPYSMYQIDLMYSFVPNLRERITYECIFMRSENIDAVPHL